MFYIFIFLINLRRLCKKIEDYQLSNREWEKTVTQINSSLNNIEENNKYLKNENDDLKKFANELELKLQYYNQKDATYDSNISKLWQIQEEYDQSIKNYKQTQEELRRKFEEKEKKLQEEFFIKEKEYLNHIESLTNDNNKLFKDFENVRKNILMNSILFNNLTILVYYPFI